MMVKVAVQGSRKAAAVRSSPPGSAARRWKVFVLKSQPIAILRLCAGCPAPAYRLRLNRWHFQWQKNRATLAAIRSVSDHCQSREQPPRHASGNGTNSAPAQFQTCIGAEGISDKQGIVAVLCQRGKGCNSRNFVDFYQFLTRYPHNVHSHITGNELDSGFSGRTHKFR